MNELVSVARRESGHSEEPWRGGSGHESCNLSEFTLQSGGTNPCVSLGTLSKLDFTRDGPATVRGGF